MEGDKMRNAGQELLYATRAMSVLLSTGAGLEMAMKYIADDDYGEISILFTEALTESNQMYTLEAALANIRERTSSHGFKKVISNMILSLRGDIDLVDSLERIAERETRDRQLDIERFVGMLETRSEIFMIGGILIPIIIMVMIFVQVLLSDSMFVQWGGISPEMVLGVLMLLLLILSSLVIDTKRKEPFLC